MYDRILPHSKILRSNEINGHNNEVVFEHDMNDGRVGLVMTSEFQSDKFES